jgi:thiol-disulfide isomerase/thioredoxin
VQCGYHQGVVIRTVVSTLVLATLCACKTVADEPRPAPSAAARVGHVQLDEAPASGDVDAVVKEALAKSTAQKRRLVVYVGATWCEPCRRFHEAAGKGELDATFPDLDLLAFDLDRDSERLAAAGYVSKYIPLCALPKTDGTSSGKQIEGGIKGEGAVAYITPKLQALLAE